MDKITLCNCGEDMYIITLAGRSKAVAQGMHACIRKEESRLLTCPLPSMMWLGVGILLEAISKLHLLKRIRFLSISGLLFQHQPTWLLFGMEHPETEESFAVSLVCKRLIITAGVRTDMSFSGDQHCPAN